MTRKKCLMCRKKTNQLYENAESTRQIAVCGECVNIPCFILVTTTETIEGTSDKFEEPFYLVSTDKPETWGERICRILCFS